MTEYIDRERVLELASHNILDMDYFMEIPAADVAPVVHGKWVYGEDVDIQCSICGADALTLMGDYGQITSKYCPFCGSKMDLID